MSEGLFQNFTFFVQSNYHIALGVSFLLPKVKGYFCFFDLSFVFLQLSRGVKGVMLFYINKKMADACSSFRWPLVALKDDIQSNAPPFTRWASACQP